MPGPARGRAFSFSPVQRPQAWPPTGTSGGASVEQAQTFLPRRTRRRTMKRALDWLAANDANLVADLARLVAVQSISTDGEHAREIDQSAELTCELMRNAGLNNVEVLKTGDSYPYAYGEWLGAPGKPTVFLYSHHDV